MNFGMIKLCHLHGDGCVTGGRPGLQTRACGTNTVVDRFDSYTSPPYFFPVSSITILFYQYISASISQVTDEVLYTGLVEMQEMDELEE